MVNLTVDDVSDIVAHDTLKTQQLFFTPPLVLHSWNSTIVHANQLQIWQDLSGYHNASSQHGYKRRISSQMKKQKRGNRLKELTIQIAYYYILLLIISQMWHEHSTCWQFFFSFFIWQHNPTAHRGISKSTPLNHHPIHRRPVATTTHGLVGHFGNNTTTLATD